MSLIPNPPSPPSILAWDKLQHTIAWGLLAWWFLQAWEGQRPIGWCLFLLVVAAIVELLQGTTGYRTPDGLDMLANSVGVALGFTLWYTPLGGTFHWAEGLAAGRRW
ncbi:MAG: VanZ family protein [Nitrococcus sp.]|nr:VanZ family protein [Nitrococcus sp.]